MTTIAPNFLVRFVFIVTANLLLSGSVLAQSANNDGLPSESPMRIVNFSGSVPERVVSATRGVCGVTFAIYRDQNGGAPLWQETQNVTLDTGGHYTVQLGSTTSGLPPDLFPSDQQRWLGVQLQGEVEQPRVLLGSVPYALKALEADRLAGHAASDFVTTDTVQSVVQAQLQQQATGVSIVASSTADGKYATQPSAQGPSAYILNQATQQPGANFNIDGNGTVGGMLANTSTVVGSTPDVSGQVAIMPDDLDTVHQYWGQAGHNMHFRLSSAQLSPDGGKDLIMAPYKYGMAIEYAGVLEAWVNDFSVHHNHRIQDPSTPARLWVGDESDTGGLFATAFYHGGGRNSYTVLASDAFGHTSHGSMMFQLRDPADAYNFQWGPYNSEVTRASISNTATATSLDLMYGSIQGIVTADSNNSGAVNVGSVSATPLNLVTGSTPQLTVFPDGNVSIGNSQDSAKLSVGSSGLFSVSDAGTVTATSLNLTSSLAASASSNSAIVGTTNASPATNVVAGVEGVSSLPSSIGVYGQSDSPNGIGLQGIALGSGNTIGVIAQASSTSGFAIDATETATSGHTAGLVAQIYSPTGIGALILNNASGPVTGSLISARTKSGVQFSVDGVGDVNAAGWFSSPSFVRGNQLISSAVTGTSPLQVGSTTQVANLNASFLGGLPSTGFILNQAAQQNGANFNITGNGTVGGMFSAGSIASSSLQVAGPVTIAGIGNGLTFPDGTTQKTASQVGLNSNIFTGQQEAPALLADSSIVIGSQPDVTGQVAIMPDDQDTVHQYWGQAGHNMHFRLSSAQPGPGGSKDFIIAPYKYGMAMEYAGVLEFWVDEFSVHTNQHLRNGFPAQFWVGDEHDTGGLFATAFDHGGGPNSYTVLASDRFGHTSHGSMVFQLRDPADAYNFQWGAYNSEVTRASIANTATATNLNLMYGSVQGTVTADSNNSGAVNVGSVSATPVNLIAGNTPIATVFPDGNVSIGNSQDSAKLSVGSGGLFSVSDAGVVTTASLTVTSSLNVPALSANSISGNSLALSGTLTSNAINTGAVNANSLTAASLTTPSLNATSGVFSTTTTNALTATTAAVATANSNTDATSSLILGGGTPIVGHLSVSSVIDFGSIQANSCITQALAVAGAGDGDTVALGIPTALGSVDGVTWFGWVSAVDTVSIRGCNATLAATVDPPAVSVRVDVWKH